MLENCTVDDSAFFLGKSVFPGLHDSFALEIKIDNIDCFVKMKTFKALLGQSYLPKVLHTNQRIRVLQFRLLSVIILH